MVSARVVEGMNTLVLDSIDGLAGNASGGSKRGLRHACSFSVRYQMRDEAHSRTLRSVDRKIVTAPLRAMAYPGMPKLIMREMLAVLDEVLKAPFAM